MAPTPRLEALTRRLEALTLKGALALPEPVQRRLAGKRIVKDGQTLATDTQLMLRLAREPGAETLTLLLLAGHGPWSGDLILAIDDAHGVNRGDLIVLPLWLAGMACCAWLWRR